MPTVEVLPPLHGTHGWMHTATSTPCQDEAAKQNNFDNEERRSTCNPRESDSALNVARIAKPSIHDSRATDHKHMNNTDIRFTEARENQQQQDG